MTAAAIANTKRVAPTATSDAIRWRAGSGWSHAASGLVGGPRDNAVIREDWLLVASDSNSMTVRLGAHSTAAEPVASRASARAAACVPSASLLTSPQRLVQHRSQSHPRPLDLPDHGRRRVRGVIP